MTFARKRPLPGIFVVVILVALTVLARPANVLAQDWRDVSADLDGDGLPDSVEESGWYNAAGGPFVTDYTDADSDDDGLSDGYEKLYETNPLDDHSPGIYVEYQDNFETQKYFPWQRYGNRLATFPPPFGRGSLIVRRGTTFSVGGPADAQIQISPSIPGLTTLTAVRNACASRWEISVPANGTVGIYTVTMYEGSWSKSLNLYVIFQLPTDRSSAFVQAFAYDDNPDNNRDETSIHYSEYVGNLRQYDAGDGPEYAWVPAGQWVNHGYGWNFLNQQYEDYVFEAHVIQAINGKTNTWDATKALVARADEVTCFGNPAYKNSSWCVLHPALCSDNNRNECSSISGLVSAFNRSAGIPARPVFVDWRNSSFDHATEVWTKPSWGSWDWYIVRGYATDEAGISGCETSNFAGGYNGPTTTTGWYLTDGSQGIYAANEYWPWSEVGSYWSVNNDDFRQGSWDIDLDNKVGKILKKSWWETRFMDYWGWPAEPEVIGSPPSGWPEPPAGIVGLGIASSSEPSMIQFDQVIADYGVDVDGDGRFDQLVFEIQVSVAQAGDYWFRGALGGAYTPQGTGQPLEAIGHLYLTEGSHTIELRFDGIGIYMSKANGPYRLDGLWATDIENPTESDFFERELAYTAPDYQTAPYKFTDFGVAGATLPGDYNYHAVDSDGDGYADALIVEANLNIEKAGTYTVQGVLHGGQGEPEKMLSHATWTGSNASVTLKFEGLKDTVGPYVLRYLYVRNEAGRATDSIVEPIVLGEIPEFSAKPISLGVEAAVPSDIGAAFLITGGYADTRLDTDGDGKFDQLVISTAVQVEPGEGGQAYRLEGWLVDQHNSLVVWAISDPQVLSEGVHSLSLAFDGRIINEHGVDGPFTLVALKALAGDGFDVQNTVEIAYTTPAYSHGDFEEPITGQDVVGIFEDRIENGPGQWIAESPWTLSSEAWFSYSHAWKANAAGTQSGSLTLPLQALSNNILVQSLRFRTCYNMQSANDLGYLEASTNGGAWTRVTTFSGATSDWSTRFFDLSGLGKAEDLRLRFKVNSQSGVRWYVDDVYVYGLPDDDGDGLSNEQEDLNQDGDPTNDDTDGDGVPDYLEPNDVDTDQDGIPNNQDPDDDGDGVPTIKEDRNNDGDPTNDDTDGDGTSNYLDRDDDGDGIYTDQENPDPNHDGNPADAQDTDHDSIPDYLDRDDDGDGVYTQYEDADPNHDHNPADAQDADGDGKPNYLDRDDDGDGVYTDYENPDSNGDGNPADAQNSDGDSLRDYLDRDDDNDGINTDDESADPNQDGNPADARNIDGDGQPDYLDPDDDNDGIPTTTEGPTNDQDQDHVPDYLEPNNRDTDNDGLEDWVDPDDDGDGVPTAEEDWNRDGDPTNDDANNNGIPDYLDPTISESPKYHIYLPIIVR